MRTTFNLGGPLEVNGTRFKNKNDRSKIQDNYVEIYVNKTNDAIMEIVGRDGVADETGMSGGMVNLMQTLRVFFALVINDAYFAFYSLAFVFLYLWYHLGSFFLANIGIGIIIFSFPFTACICNGIFGVTYFGFLHVLIIFIVLGIAADDIFVFIDGWR